MSSKLRLLWVAMEAGFVVLNANLLYDAGAGRARISALFAAGGCVMWAYFLVRDLQRLRNERAA